jgi:hypothetical protein
MVGKKSGKKQEKGSEKPEGRKEQLSDKERVDKGMILARTIIEVLGAPKDYVEESIQLVVDRMRNIDGSEVVSESTYEAEEKGKLFVTFSEIEIWFKDIDQILKFLFEFTPSSIEIMQPTTLSLNCHVFSGVCNDFLLKMHDLGLKLKDLSAATKLLQNNADALVRNLFKLALSEPKSLDEISKVTGIPEKNAEAILKNFEKVGIVEKNGEKYHFIKK